MVTPSAIASQNFNKVFIMSAIKQVTKYETPDGLLFDTEDEAARVVDAAAKIVYGEFAHKNIKE